MDIPEDRFRKAPLIQRDALVLVKNPNIEVAAETKVVLQVAFSDDLAAQNIPVELTNSALFCLGEDDRRMVSQDYSCHGSLLSILNRCVAQPHLRAGACRPHCCRRAHEAPPGGCRSPEARSDGRGWDRTVPSTSTTLSWPVDHEEHRIGSEPEVLADPAPCAPAISRSPRRRRPRRQSRGPGSPSRARLPHRGCRLTRSSSRSGHVSRHR